MFAAKSSISKDHPRIHGEHHTELTQIESVQGSPPHTRGTLSSFSLRQFFCRITPAYTGNTQFRSFNHPLPEDHPRIHGEHQHIIHFNTLLLGSPPHTRGTLRQICFNRRITRITPAYTGNTTQVKQIKPLIQDHPRIHGGTPYWMHYYSFKARITPAYTGNTL